jgi:hypothetical protein
MPMGALSDLQTAGFADDQQSFMGCSGHGCSQFDLIQFLNPTGALLPGMREFNDYTIFAENELCSPGESDDGFYFSCIARDRLHLGKPCTC